MPDAEEPWWEEEPALGTPNPLEQLTGPAFNANESLRILGLVAVTVTRLGEWPPGEEFTVPYPDVAQTAVDRICLAGIRRFCNDHEGDGPKYPRSLQELLAWCRERDVQEWGFIDLPADLELAGRLLVEDTAAPSRLCEELALRYKHEDTVGKSIESILKDHIREMYDQADAPEGSVAFLKKLVDSPILTSAQLARFKVSRPHIPEEVIAACYIPVHDRYYDRHGHANACDYCGLLRVMTRNKWRCEIATCPDHRRSRGGTQWDRVDHLYHATRPHREFLIAPRRLKRTADKWPMAPDAPRDLEGR
ncbi:MULTISPECIES: hypothetical protein [Actinomadura]|uniref:pPIWI-RE three-gene island domain-containing protein n=1 Tax=Actinomadura yumaensis TaxID=111807 RepID=A0ABW2CY69_9ACTN|nr:hypothetical protein [Actinomadura sp. J1-007]MWK36336.1 hypothetical protein [Actinomadura sp. J1-007]